MISHNFIIPDEYSFNYIKYNIFSDIECEQVFIDDILDLLDYKRYIRESIVVTIGNDSNYIDKVPFYDCNGKKIIDALEYFQFQVCKQLENDIRLFIAKNDVNVLQFACKNELPDVMFRTNTFPFVEWQILTEELDVKVIGQIFIKEKV